MSSSARVPQSLEEKLEMLEARFTQPLTILPGVGRSNSGLPVDHHSNLSEHSFGFSSSNHGHHHHNRSGSQTTNTSHSNSTLANALLLVNNSNQTVTSPNNHHFSLSRVHQATTKHLQKVGRQLQHSPPAHSNSSQQTLVTGHHQTHAAKQNRVVAESPPIHASDNPNPVTVEKPHVARTLLGNANTGGTTSTVRKLINDRKK